MQHIVEITKAKCLFFFSKAELLCLCPDLQQITEIAFWLSKGGHCVSPLALVIFFFFSLLLFLLRYINKTSRCHKLIEHSFDFLSSVHFCFQISNWFVKSASWRHTEHQHITSWPSHHKQLQCPMNCVITWCRRSRRVAVDSWVPVVYVIRMTSFCEVVLDILCLNQYRLITVTGSNRVHVCMGRISPSSLWFILLSHHPHPPFLNRSPQSPPKMFQSQKRIWT